LRRCGAGRRVGARPGKREERPGPADGALRRWYGTAVGGLGWMPGVFWRTTLVEFFEGVAGFNRANRPGPEPMSRERLDALADAYDDNRSLKERRAWRQKPSA